MTTSPNSQEKETRSLYDRVGKSVAIDALVMSLYLNLTDDEMISPFFKNIDLLKQIEHQKEFLTSVLGGPQAHNIDKVISAHSHLNISPIVFERFNQILHETLSGLELSPSIISEIMTITATVEHQILNSNRD